MSFQQFYFSISCPPLTTGENIQLPLLFSELNRQGMTLVVVTHNLDLARRAERMYTLLDGQIVSCEERACAEGWEVSRVVQEGEIIFRILLVRRDRRAGFHLLTFFYS